MALTPVDAQLLDDLITHQLDLLRLDAHLQGRAVWLLNNLQTELEIQLRRANLTEFNRQRLTQLLKATSTTIDEFYTALNNTITPQISGAVPVTVQATHSAMDGGLTVSIRAALPTTAMMRAASSDWLVFGAKTSTWWAQQGQDTAFKFANAVRAGITAGNTIEQIVARVAGTSTQQGVMDIARSNARILVQSSIMSAANSARMATYKVNRDISKGWQQLSTLDGHTTDICIAYSGAQWNLDFEPINGNTLPFDGGTPRHWGCRSLIIPILKTFKELGVDIPEAPTGQRASALGPVPANMTFEQFLRRRSVEEQDAQLGKGRATLWRSGKITLRQLLDMRGNPLTLEQLKAKYGV